LIFIDEIGAMEVSFNGINQLKLKKKSQFPQNTRNRNPVKEHFTPETIELVREGYDGEVKIKEVRYVYKKRSLIPYYIIYYKTTLPLLRKSNHHEVFQEKEFLPRSSLLTDLLETKHIRPIYNFLKAAFLIHWLHLLICSFLADGRYDLMHY
jgi:hypothetical protein